MSADLPNIHWTELVTADPAGAAKFYATVVGWTVEEMEMAGAPPGSEPYRVCMNGEEMVCGIMARPPEMGDAPDMWTSYIGVADVDAAAKRAEAAGGRVLNGPFDIPNIGRIAMIADPTGATVGIMTPA